MKLKHLDLFAGIGGFSLGLESTGGFETVGFCEIDKAAQKVLKKHWPNVPIYEDVTKLTGEQIGAVDIITGGFPCQDISLAGKGAGLAGARSGLWFEFHRIIKETKPKWVIAENVSALRSRGLDQVLRSLSEIGYDAEWHCIPASAVGAPHRRDRIWILAYPNGSMATNGGECSLSEEESNQWRDKQGGGEWVCGQGCLRITGESSKDDVAYANNGSGSVRRDWEFSNLEKTYGLWYNIRRGTEEFISRQWRKGESRPYGVADGVPNRVDRLKQLGNAVVPQIPELLGNAILKFEDKEL